MKTLKMSLFDEFKCIAASCKDSCCAAGWQIDIDSKTMQKYTFTNDEFIQSINQKIVHNNGSHFFQNDDMHKCPYFRKDGLCDIVSKKGDKYLCDVCRTFPRIYNNYSTHTEELLSLTCEEAARLLLDSEKISFVYNGLNEIELNMNDAFVERKDIMTIIQDNSFTLAERIKTLKAQSEFYKVDFSPLIAERNFEWLRTDLSRYFSVCDFEFDLPLSLSSLQFENLFLYFLFGHYLKLSENFSKIAIIRFCLFSTLFCDWLANIYIKCDEKHKSDASVWKVNAIKEYCREIENSQKNLQILLNFFEK